MRRRYDGAVSALLFLAACAGDGGGRSGPALEARPEVQTCLPDVSAGMPELLSETGCFADLETLEPGTDLIAYEVNSPLWTDGAFKRRFMVVPSPKQVEIRADGSWAFPNGSVLIKVFGFEFVEGDARSRRPVETRFIVRRDNQWEYSTYQWNPEGTDAVLLDRTNTAQYTIDEGGEPRVIEYLFPDFDACITCHGADIDDVLGPKMAQINRTHDYDGLAANQLAAMAEIGLFALDPGQEIDPELERRMADPQDEGETLEDRARAYLDANCAHCHRPGGWAPSDIGLDLRYQVPFEATGLCEPMKFFEWAGLPRIAPGNPEGSGIQQRFLRKDALRMPSLGTSTIDPSGEALLRDWIAELDTCP